MWLCHMEGAICAGQPSTVHCFLIEGPEDDWHEVEVMESPWSSCVGACCRIIRIGEGSIGDGCWSCDNVESWGDGERSGAAGGDCGCEDGGNSGNVDNCSGVANSSCECAEGSSGGADSCCESDNGERSVGDKSSEEEATDVGGRIRSGSADILDTCWGGVITTFMHFP